VPVGWRFDERGPARLGAVEVRSTFPFGLAEHRVVLPAPADLLVYPRPLPASAIGRHRRGAGDVQSERPGGAGDFLGLRRYRPGDNPMRVHWPTTARLDRLVVVERAAETDTAVEVEVKASDRPATWERELSRACGEVHRAFALGRSVGLLLPAVGREPARRMPPSVGGGWRRTLLDALARLPRMDP
jgi:uncharacterized protein (DUF58 family)